MAKKNKGDFSKSDKKAIARLIKQVQDLAKLTGKPAPDMSTLEKALSGLAGPDPDAEVIVDAD